MSRDCGDVCSVRESGTITLKVRRRASAGHSRVQGVSRDCGDVACVSPELF